MEGDELFEHELSASPKDGLREFIYHEAKHGKTVLATLTKVALHLREIGREKTGSISLVGGARCSDSSFTLHNDLAPFYIAAVLIVRPDLGDVLTVRPDFVRALRSAKWNPSHIGGPEDD